MKSAWLILLISAFTDFIINSGTAYVAVSGTGIPLTRQQIIIILVGATISFARTIQQALKASPETSAALKGSLSSTTTLTQEKTP